MEALHIMHGMSSIERGEGFEVPFGPYIFSGGLSLDCTRPRYSMQIRTGLEHLRDIGEDIVNSCDLTVSKTDSVDVITVPNVPGPRLMNKVPLNHSKLVVQMRNTSDRDRYPEDLNFWFLSYPYMHSSTLDHLMKYVKFSEIENKLNDLRRVNKFPHLVYKYSEGVSSRFGEFDLNVDVDSNVKLNYMGDDLINTPNTHTWKQTKNNENYYFDQNHQGIEFGFEMFRVKNDTVNNGKLESVIGRIFLCPKGFNDLDHTVLRALNGNDALLDGYHYSLQSSIVIAPSSMMPS